MEHIELELHGRNPNETLEGMHSIVFDIIKELTALEDRNMIITSIDVKVKAQEGPGIQEYEQFDADGNLITIDKTAINEIIKRNDQSDDNSE